MSDISSPTHAAIDAAAVGNTLHRLRERSPLVQCLTNNVVMGWTANVLLAAGAAPAMVDNPREAGEFAAVADGVLINLGTPQDSTIAAMKVAVTTAADAGTPWVLDPVAVGGLSWRTGLVPELIQLEPPAVIRGNASEIMAVAGGSGGRGVDAIDSPEQAALPARQLSLGGPVVAVSGEVDHLVHHDRLVRVRNGHPWMTKVTGVGCALGALMAAFAGVEDDYLLAAVAATATLTVAADLAAENARGPGSFAMNLLDELSLLEPDTLAERVRLA
ncbi:hydroxyethylthiazole kinase [Demetria terragena]|uniref:hydroxyethylthiazole kinase n=1 Tax=Demetria terragena TaxID=63959 RepID=UPI00038186B9|nr:hydroxyethylthiazole kinase [Demetria terragena]